MDGWNFGKGSGRCLKHFVTKFFEKSHIYYKGQNDNFLQNIVLKKSHDQNLFGNLPHVLANII